jgi:hypothetical protein
MEHDIEFNVAREAFRSNPSVSTGKRYRREALEAWDEGVIDDVVLLEVLRETIVGYRVRTRDC